MIQMYKTAQYPNAIEALCLNLKKSKNSIFEPETIVGADRSTQVYITEEIASRNGIAANINYLTINQFFQKLFFLLRPTTLKFSLISDIKAIQFIYEALEDPSFVNNYQFQSDYYSENNNKRYGLACKMQALFSKYAEYQPEYLTAWSTNTLISTNAEEAWQANLWRLYRDKIDTSQLIDSFDVFNTLNNELDNLEDHFSVIATQIPTIHLVKSELLSEIQKELLGKIGQNSTVYSYQFDAGSSEHDLVKQWKFNTSDFKQAQVIELPSILNGEETLLKQLQNTLLTSQNNITTTDDSIKIEGHYTPYREVEGVLNYFIHQSKNSGGVITARNCIVYCCNLKAYIPAIHYFFNKKPFAIPYHIVGEKAFSSKSAIHAFKEIIELDWEQMKPNEVLSIIEYPSIQAKFKLDDLELYKSWIQLANIRFGYQGNAADETQLVSWKHGLDRILFGSTMGLEAWYQEIAITLDLTEANTFEQFIHFKYFVDQLYIFKSKSEELQSISKWTDYTKELLHFFFDLDKEEQLTQLINQLLELQTQNYASIAFKEWCLFLLPLVQHPFDFKYTATHGITFIELANAQIIPKEITAVLGLNYDAYPATETPLDFDLLKTKTTEQTNLSKKQRDKNTFLQLLLQTQSNLYLSYLSHNAKDNSENPPSILIEQLIDTINQEKERIKITHHPLQRYNSSYNTRELLISYTINNAINEADFKARLTQNDTAELQLEQINIPSFNNFFIDSFKHYNLRELGLYNNDTETELLDSESFVLNALEEWYIKDWALQQEVSPTTMDEKMLQNALTTFKVQGRLPLNELGQYSFDKTIVSIEKVLEVFYTEIKNKELNIINLNHPYSYKGLQVHFTASLKIYDRTYYQVCFTNSLGKHKWNWLLNSYFLFQENQIDETVFIFQNSKEMRTIKFNKSSFLEIFDDSILQVLIELFVQGKKGLVPVYISSQSKLYDDVEAFKDALFKDNYLSEYISKEINKSYFKNDPDYFQSFFENYTSIASLINQIN